jgi:hypothetical protein
LSAIPSPGARALAFVAILLGGLGGGLIGHTLTGLQCTGDCTVPQGLGMWAGSIVGAAGAAIVAILALRAQGEWRELANGS